MNVREHASTMSAWLLARLRPLRRYVTTPRVFALLILTTGIVGFVLTGHYDVEVAHQDGDTWVNSSSGFFQRLWATLGMFTGAYISLNPDWDPTPPTPIAVVGTVALVLTFVTAGSLLLISRRVHDFVRLWWGAKRYRLVVIGEGRSAAAIVRSGIVREFRTILITDTHESVAGRATNRSIPIIAAGQFDSALTRPAVQRVLRRVHHTVVATDSDGSNLNLHNKIREEIRKQSSSPPEPPDYIDDPAHVSINRAGDCHDLVLIHDPGYADLLLPPKIRGALPDSDVTCPAHNIAEHVCLLIVAATTGRTADTTVEFIPVPTTDTGADDVPGLGIEKALTVAVRRLGWALDGVYGKQFARRTEPEHRQRIPALVLAGEGTPGAGAETIRIYHGQSSAAVAAQVITDSPVGLRIAVADYDIIQSAVGPRRGHTVLRGSEWLDNMAPHTTNLLLVVDPAEIGFDASLVADDMSTQWARMFSLTYDLMFAENDPVVGWRPGAPMGESVAAEEDKAEPKTRPPLTANCAHPPDVNGPEDPVEYGKWKARKRIGDRYSSEAAVHHMVKLLADLGYELEKTTGKPHKPTFTEPERDYVARAEHHHWLQRRWRDTSRRTKPEYEVSTYSGSGSNFYCFDGLVELERIQAGEDLQHAANYNRRLLDETYPAIAASWGYEIVRSEHREPESTINACPPPPRSRPPDWRCPHPRS